jgi:CheY-like chemotaxis protein
VQRLPIVPDFRHVLDLVAVEARHGQEALDLLTQLTPSGLIVDLAMPVMDGVTLLRELRTRGLPIPCLVATATTWGSARVGDLSVAAVVPKPFNLDALLGAVREHCGPPAPAPGCAPRNHAGTGRVEPR